ncbi:MAG: HEPN domain-containing protein [Flavobacteriales bacterium]|nr:HEPN domain-containing protein [Flavobacteriales bacterium]
MPKTSTPAPLAGALFNGAKQYHIAANTLYSSGDSKAVEDPLYFLFAHSIELTLKAFLRFNVVPFKPIHDLDKLLDDAQKVGLKLKKSTSDAIKNLKSENHAHGFRYFVFASASRTEIDWLREATEELMTEVQTALDKHPDDKDLGLVFKVTIGKPRPKAKE